MKSFDYVITDPIGIHARPAGILVKEAKKYASAITLKANGKSAKATSLMAIMAMGVKTGQTVTVEVAGDDEDAAFDGMQAFCKDNL